MNLNRKAVRERSEQLAFERQQRIGANTMAKDRYHSMVNSLALYEDTGRKAGEAANKGDWATVKFHRDWMRRAEALEQGDDKKLARDMFDSTYMATIKVWRPLP